ncbi:YciE/YciF ferroxidase family protein [Falsigemmobacter faecalis]|uniref:Ferritin-like domain-containing protein n=1 Tax=Falsigemmobacter faecalis TaxID=2488730 RepID=A0A3P3D4Y1_9RHOB|nr:DUF892 family protein [Falsigemmobacter faecalis]RRH68844.1 ferritin-like domain-containing protein [Falsigemmobacter faecalis]
MKTRTLDDLFPDLLRDVWYAGRKILKALPEMACGAQSADLKAAFEKHRDDTEIHVERLQQVFDIPGKTCPAIEGIPDEGEEVPEAFKESPALDAGLVAAAQAVAHYEISRYGSLRNWAKTLGQGEIAEILQTTLDEEEKTDDALTALADRSINRAVLKAA